MFVSLEELVKGEGRTGSCLGGVSVVLLEEGQVDAHTDFGCRIC